MSGVRQVRVVDSHTAGEPTRVVIEGGPDLGSGSLLQRIAAFRANEDRFRSAIVNEPRGSDVLVGALLVEPVDKTCAAGVIFFNNVGFLGMCGHGAIGVVATLAHLGRIGAGVHRLETCTGVVTATLNADGSVALANVSSFRKAQGVECQVPGGGTVQGDVAWGGNWFYFIEDHGQSLILSRCEELTDYAWRIRQAINAQGHPEVDHIELLGPAVSNKAHARNFVLCPGKVYDRSPCGTGTSAKLACLAADGKLAEGEAWIQESIIGSTFKAHYRWIDRSQGHITPIIEGTAHIIGDALLHLDPADPFRWGIRL
ncbi:MAG TPA: proline racemase family protein [Steroidobacteraceae bacterium]|jgi:4-hydroxyproline epimerase|nr:proline racemase family protein [Steroidobacteraceae bacterium]